jgi:uncharacterized Zn finger protein (UPF0148 family)
MTRVKGYNSYQVNKIWTQWEVRLAMLFLRACPKCGGDLFMDRDMYGGYVKCLQCGLMRYTEEEQRPAARKRESVLESEAA